MNRVAVALALLLIATASFAQRDFERPRTLQPKDPSDVEHDLRKLRESRAVEGLPGHYPNATGVSISNVTRTGFDVTFDVTLTTTGPTTTMAFNPGRLGYTTWGSSYGAGGSFATLTFSTYIPVAYQIFSGGAGNGMYGQFATFHYNFPTTTQYSVTYSYFVRFYVRTAVLPAVDFGDGATIPYTDLTLSSSGTVGGRAERVFRGTFSHTYAAPGNYTIRVASTCCPATYPSYNPNVSPNYGTLVTWNEAPPRATYGTYTDIAFSPSFAFTDYQIYLYNAFNTPAYTFSTNTYYYTGGSIRGGTLYRNFTFNTPGYPGAIVATAAADLSVLEVPTASSYGLLALALLLAAAGFMVLRR